MVEYSSLTCPHCAAFHNDTLPTIKKEYIEAGKVKLEMRDFPLDQFALRAAAMARCAPEARYFALMDLLFKQQAKWSRAQNPIDELKKIGRFAGIAPEQADACMTDKTLLDGILEARLLAQRTHDIRSTPTFIIGNVKVSGNQSIEEFRSVFDGQLT
ncbi:MAG: DsbA family protein [Alphaproteobacteria bacterium]|nr:DsbA family protein [Alphaproteobacteria bacterium]